MFDRLEVAFLKLIPKPENGEFPPEPEAYRPNTTRPPENASVGFGMYFPKLKPDQPEPEKPDSCAPLIYIRVSLQLIKPIPIYLFRLPWQNC